MKKLLIILIVFVFTLTANAQEEQGDAVNTDSLVFTLDIVVKDVENEKFIEGAMVKLYGSDGSEQTDTTDVNGHTSTFILKPNTSYKTVVEKMGCLNARGKETTVGETKSKKYFHEYALQSFRPPYTALPFFYFDYNKSTTGSSNKETQSMIFNTLKENPTIVFQLKGYRAKNEKEAVSIERAQTIKEALLNVGIESGRVLAVDGGIRDFKLTPYHIQQNRGKSEDEENRSVVAKVISDDYKVLVFTLDIVVKDLFTEEPLPCVTVKIIGIDGSSREYTPSENEQLAPITLNAGVAYSVLVELDGYLNAKGMETTVGLTESKKFVHEYTLQRLKTHIIKLPPVEFEHNKFKVKGTMNDSLNIMSNIMKDNPTIVVEILAYQDSTEAKGVSLKRAIAVEKGLIKLGIAPERLVLIDHGMEPFPVTRKNQNPCIPVEKFGIECRCIAYIVVSDDYVPSK